VKKPISKLLISAIAIAMSGCSPAPEKELTENTKSSIEEKQVNSESVRLSHFFAENFEQSLNAPL
jgi:PBP1b-binding outer membrane lipoprotein LpoB